MGFTKQDRARRKAMRAAERAVPGKMLWAKPGVPVWYRPVFDGPRFAAVIDEGEPRELGGTWCVRLRGLGADYVQYTSRASSTIAAAALTHVERRTPECRCAGPDFDPDVPCPVADHGKPPRIAAT